MTEGLNTFFFFFFFLYQYPLSCRVHCLAQTYGVYHNILEASRNKYYVLKLTSTQEIKRIKKEDRKQYKQIRFLSKAKEQLVGLVLHTKATPPSLSISLSLYDLYILHPSLTYACCLSTTFFILWLILFSSSILYF